MTHDIKQSGWFLTKQSQYDTADDTIPNGLTANYLCRNCKRPVYYDAIYCAACVLPKDHNDTASN